MGQAGRALGAGGRVETVGDEHVDPLGGGLDDGAQLVDVVRLHHQALEHVEVRGEGAQPAQLGRGHVAVQLDRAHADLGAELGDLVGLGQVGDDDALVAGLDRLDDGGGVGLREVLVLGRQAQGEAEPVGALLDDQIGLGLVDDARDLDQSVHVCLLWPRRSWPGPVCDGFREPSGDGGGGAGPRCGAGPAGALRGGTAGALRSGAG